jgi:hypothetical protein
MSKKSWGRDLQSSKIPIEILIGQSLRRRIEIRLFSSRQLQMSVVGLYLIRHADHGEREGGAVPYFDGFGGVEDN